MLLPLKLICDPKKARRDGTSLVYIQYCYSSSNRTLLNTTIAIPANYWDENKEAVKKVLPAEYGNYGQLNDRLKQMLRSAEDLIGIAEKQAIEDKGTYVKQAFKPNLDIETVSRDMASVQILSVKRPFKTDFFAQIDDYMASKNKKVSNATIAIIKNVKKYLLAYQEFSKKHISFSSLDYTFYESFIEFLRFDYVHLRRKEKLIGLKTNTIGKIIKQLRTFVKDRVRRKIIQPIDLTDFAVLEEETDAIYLSHEEIAAIYTTDLTDYPYLMEYRDLFVLACLTGFRFSDFSHHRSCAMYKWFSSW